jgi:hypothetical protein
MICALALFDLGQEPAGVNGLNDFAEPTGRFQHGATSFCFPRRRRALGEVRRQLEAVYQVRRGE